MLSIGGDTVVTAIVDDAKKLQLKYEQGWQEFLEDQEITELIKASQDRLQQSMAKGKGKEKGKAGSTGK